MYEGISIEHQADGTAALARSITWTGSKQTYYTARLIVDSDLVDDFYRAYAYFRWADDIVDISTQSSDERAAFVDRQKCLIDRLYRHERPADLSSQEQMVADLISHERAENPGLRSFITGFLAVIEFDARREGRLISQDELTWYSACLGEAVTDGIQYFIGNRHPHLASPNRYLGATAAHIAHMLRDMVADVADGYINIPREYLEEHNIGPSQVTSAAFQAWVRSRVDLARRYFREGKLCLDELVVLRRKIAGYWYAARYEGVLDAIERDGYVLRAEYGERRRMSAWIRIALLGTSVTLRHIGRGPSHQAPQA